MKGALWMLRDQKLQSGKAHPPQDTGSDTGSETEVKGIIHMTIQSN